MEIEENEVMDDNEGQDYDENEYGDDEDPVYEISENVLR